MGDVNWGLTADIPQLKQPDFAGGFIQARQAGIAERYADEDQQLKRAKAVQDAQQNQADIASQTAQDANDTSAEARAKGVDKLKAISTFATAVSSVAGANPTPETVSSAFDGLHPYFADQIGMDPQHFEEFKSSVVQNPMLLQGLASKAAQAVHVLTPGSIQTDQSGNVLRRNPAQVRLVKVKDKNGYDQIVAFDAQGNVVDDAPDASAPPPATAGGAPQPGNLPAGATRGDRNYNPFNVKTPPQGPWQGQTGVDSYGHAIFDTPENGMRAGDLNLQAYAKRGITTPEAFVDRYAGEAAPQVKANYAAAIRGAVGSNFDLTNPQTRAAITPAILHSEGTHVPLPQGGTATAPGAQPPRRQAGFSAAPTDASGADDLGTTGNVGSYSHDALFDMAAAAARDGKPIPTLGRGEERARAAANNIRAQILRIAGRTGQDIPTIAAAYKSKSSALTQNEKTLTAVQGFEDTVKSNAQLALSLLDKGASKAGSPVLNRWVQMGRRDLGGDADVTALDTAVRTVANEVAKINSGNTGAAGATDSTRREAHELLSSYQTPAQFKAALNVLLTDAGNRTKALSGQHDRLISDLRSGDFTSGLPTIAAPQAVAPAEGGQGGKPYAPGPHFNLTQAQQQVYQQKMGGAAKGPPGTRLNPIFINPADPRSSLGNVKPSQFYVVPATGEVLQRKPAGSL